jgi:hypothetical protein
MRLVGEFERARKKSQRVEKVFKRMNTKEPTPHNTDDKPNTLRSRQTPVTANRRSARLSHATLNSNWAPSTIKARVKNASATAPPSTRKNATTNMMPRSKPARPASLVVPGGMMAKESNVPTIITNPRRAPNTANAILMLPNRDEVTKRWKKNKYYYLVLAEE